MKSRSGLNAYHAPKPATIRTSKATFNLFDMFQILLFRFRNQLLVADAGESLQPHFTRRQLGRIGVFRPLFQRYTGSSVSVFEVERACVFETTQLQASVSVCCVRDEAAPRDCSA